MPRKIPETGIPTMNTITASRISFNLPSMGSAASTALSADNRDQDACSVPSSSLAQRNPIVASVRHILAENRFVNLALSFESRQVPPRMALNSVLSGPGGSRNGDP